MTLAESAPEAFVLSDVARGWKRWSCFGIAVDAARNRPN